MKSIYKTFISVIVSLSLLASTFVGALCVNLGSAKADTPSGRIFISSLQDRVEKYHQSFDITTFFQRCESVLNNTWYDPNYNLTPFGVFAMTDPNDDSKTCIILIRGNWQPDAIWQLQANGKIIQYWPRLNSDYPFTGVITSYLYCDGNTIDCQLSGNRLVDADEAFYFGTSTHYFIPNQSNMRHNSLNFYMGSNDLGRVYSGGTVNYYQPNLYPAPVSSYQNIIIKTGGRYYFTLSDQSLINSHSGSDYYFHIGFSSESVPYYSYTYQYSDFVYMAIFAWPNVSNISINGILAIDVTEPIKQQQFTGLVYSSIIQPPDELPVEFADNYVGIEYDPPEDLWQHYYDYLNQFLDAAGSNNQVVVYNPPSYVSSNTYTSYHNISVSGPENQSVGYVVFNELPEIAFDSILVISDKIFDAISINLGIIELQDSFEYIFSPYMLNQVDMIVVLPDHDYQDIVDEYNDYPSHFVNFQPGTFTIFNITFDNGLFYIGTPTVRDVNLYDREGQAFVTQRYLQKVNNYILSDGIDTLYHGLNAITKNQDNIFSTLVSGFGTVYTTIQTAGLDSQNIPWLSKVYNLMFSWNLSDKLDNLLDKLDTIIDNTSTDEAEGGFWIEPLYLFLKLFEPSTDDYTNSISAIISTYEGLPAIPSITPVAIPTSQIYLPGA